jgi:hypothetical protein
MTKSTEATEATEASEAQPTGRQRPIDAFRRVLRNGLPFHPFLMAAFPIVFLFARNLHQAVKSSDMLTPLELSLGATAIVMLVGWAIFRNAKAVALVVSAWLLLFFSYGRVSEALEGKVLGRARFLLPAWAVLAVAAIVAAFAFRERLTGTTKALNLITAVLVVMNLIPIWLYRAPVTPANSASGLTGEPAKGLSAAEKTEHQLPDIYYIVPEDYGDERTLRDLYGVETHYFVRYLEKEGFYVAKDSLANYQNTQFSLAASMNLEYLSTLLGKDATDSDAAARTLHGFAASKFLKALGYRYVHMGFWWGPTRTDPTADIEVKSGSLSEFSSILYDTTILPTLSRKLQVKQGSLDPDRATYQQYRTQLDDLVRTAKLRGPKFVFAHLGLPHEPYVFDRNGRFVHPPKKLSREEQAKLFADQAYYTTRKLQEVIGRLLDATGRKAVIILQTDEGADPILSFGKDVNILLNKIKRSVEDGTYEQSDYRVQLIAKYRILNAYFLPGVSHRQLYPSITPVNSFRLLFDLYFHAGFGLLPDRIWAKQWVPRMFINVTKLAK